ncbi:MAG: response regulator [Planctomycetota bacterium]
MKLRNRVLLLFLPPVLLLGGAATVLQWRAQANTRERSDRILSVLSQGQTSVFLETAALQETLSEEIQSHREDLVRDLALKIDGRAGSLARIGELVSRAAATKAYLLAGTAERPLLLPHLEDLMRNIRITMGLSEVAIVTLSGRELVTSLGNTLPPGGDPVLDVIPLENHANNESACRWHRRFLDWPGGGPSFQVGPNPDDPAGKMTLFIALPIRARSDRLSKTNRDVDAILKICSPLTGIVEPEAMTSEDRKLVVLGANDRFIPLEENPELDFLPVGGDVSGRFELACLGGALSIQVDLASAQIDRAGQIAASIQDAVSSGVNTAEAAASEIVEAQAKDGRRIALLAILLSLVAGGMILWISGRVGGALSRLTRVARRIAVGELEVEVKSNSKDEIGELGRAFESMREQLRARLQDLSRSNDDLRKAMGVKSEFLANMSHEIRTPMNGVIGMIQLVLETDLTSEQREYAETIQASGRSLLNLINNILDFSKAEAGKLRLEAVEFNLERLLEETSDLLSIRAHEKGLEYVLRLSQEAPKRLLGDPTRLRQILSNLIGNAIKFTNQGEVCVSARLLSEDRSGLLFRFEVVDTGIGVAEQDRGVVFQSFTQADASTTRRYGGTGLGLAISAQLAALMGGEIGVEGMPREGSTFWFTARLQRGKKAGRPVEHLPPPLARVLLVEPNRTARSALVELMSMWNLRLDAASSPGEALELASAAVIRGEPFELVLLSMNARAYVWRVLWMDLREAMGSDLPLILMHPLGRRVEASISNPDRPLVHALSKPVKRHDLARRLVEALGLCVSKEHAGASQHQALEGLSGESPVRRILVVEDDRVNQKVAAAMIRNLGHQVSLASNGAEAVQQLERTSFDLVLMDCQMPVLDGYEATAKIRKGEGSVRNPCVPIIALTAHALAGDREKCLGAGMDDYLSKPIAAELLAAAIERWATTGSVSG